MSVGIKNMNKMYIVENQVSWSAGSFNENGSWYGVPHT